MIDINRVKKAIAHVEALGWKIITGDWAIANRKECCALTAVHLAERDILPDLDNPERELADALNVSVAEVNRFVDGFDSGKRIDAMHSPSAYSMPGIEARNVGVEVREFIDGR